MSRSLLSCEAQLLALTAGSVANEAPLRRLLDSALDWQKVEYLARQERATPIVWKWLQRVGGGRVPAAVEGGWRRRSMLFEFQLRRLEQALHETVDLLAARGIEVMLLKGSALAYTAYASFADRPMGDLDILIRPERAQEAWSLLQTQGWTWPSTQWPAQSYSVHQHLPPLLDARGAGFRLELHTDLLPGGHPFRSSPGALWPHATRVRIGTGTALAPSPLHQLLHLCVHFAWSHQMQWGAWRAFRDVGALASRGDFPWSEFIEVAQDSQAATCCYWTLRLARGLAGVAVPDEVMHALQPPRSGFLLDALERHYAHQLFSSDSPCPSVTLGHRLWELGIAPHWSGHGTSRPWLAFDEVSVDSPPPPVPANSPWRRLGGQARRITGSLAYLWQMGAARRQPATR